MRLTFSLLLLCLLAGGSAIGQTQWKSFRNHRAAPATGTVSGKVATHGDYPELCYRYNWHDSLADWDTTYRETFTYFPNGALAQNIGEQYNGNGFTPHRRGTYTYFGQGELESEFGETWNGNAWENQFRTEYIWDIHGNLEQWLRFNWDVSQWDTVSGYRSIYTYFSPGLIGTQIDQYWDSNTSAWENSNRMEFTYTNLTNWDTAVFSYWNANNWVLDERSIDVVWYNFEKLLATSGRVQLHNGSAWEDLARVTGTFGQNDSHVYVWEEWTNNNWVQALKEVENFDAQGHQTLSESYDWIGAWQQSDGYLSHYTYDSQNRTEEIISESFDGYIYRYAGRLEYPSFFTSLEETISPTLSATTYPNPCTDRLNFDLGLKQNGPVEIALYDLNGTLRLQTNMRASTTETVSVPISEFLENGSYIYRISTKEGIATGKVVVSH